MPETQVVFYQETDGEVPVLEWLTQLVKQNRKGYRIKELERFKKFGALRNGLVHFGVNENFEAADETLKFAFEVLDPIAHDLFNESFVEYCAEWDDVIFADGYLEERLDQLGIQPHPATSPLFKKD